MGFIKRVCAVILSFVLVITFCTVRIGADNNSESDAKDVLRDGFYRFSESIDISGFSIMPEELAEVLASVLKDDPYLFFVNGQMSYSYVPGGKVLTVKPQYLLSGEEAFNAWELCRIYIRDLAREAQKYSGQMEKALFLHDKICLTYEYDETLESDTMYSLFVSGKGTCQSYTHVYMAALRECGIESHYVASDTIEHVWNYVRVDGEWYHTDLTWDDSAATLSGVSRRHFLCSDNMAKERGHIDWYSSVKVTCQSERFSDVNFDKVSDTDHLSGDVDHNGKISLSDLLYIRRYVDGYATNMPCAVCADLDGNGIMGEEDAEDIRKKLLATD